MQTKAMQVVIVGGGTAGWLTAAIIAAHAHARQHSPLHKSSVCVTLIESPDIPTIGVGEGTWPSMRETLRKIGIREADFMTQCDASFKQASEFRQWRVDPSMSNDRYLHPFSLPSISGDSQLLNAYTTANNANLMDSGFCDSFCYQHALSTHSLAPKQITTPQYQFISNYGYHLDAAKFSELLKQHCCNELGVIFISANVVKVNNHDNGDIASVVIDKASDSNNIDSLSEVNGDLFIDCSGSKALLIGEHYGVELNSQKHILFNDSALAVQIPYKHADSPIYSSTVSTAQDVGWVWDIGLQSRRGVGFVYASDYLSHDSALQRLQTYLRDNSTLNNQQIEQLSVKKLSFTPGYRQTFWHKNCVAIGMAAGFIEPLEASALALIEQSATMVAEKLPLHHDIMPIVAKQFNQRMLQHWQHIIRFLKLHYVLSSRDDSEYWINNRHPSSIPGNLSALLSLWQHQPPSHYDIDYANPLFPIASYQYVLYGMQLRIKESITVKESQAFSELGNNDAIAKYLAPLVEHIDINKQKQQRLLSAMPTNRVLLTKMAQYGLSPI
ncbi:tryptophan halogenase family protein [Shewanella sp. TB4-MNA-CIBAN-0142]|uniref:tryptophan halogenase family protein n=1 Tax=Shewanella sp. TB4-MNA-CIBAN-0142 TaxID=3140464 RepID=UPI0033275BA2